MQEVTYKIHQLSSRHIKLNELSNQVLKTWLAYYTQDTF